MKITSIETNISDGLPTSKTVDTLEWAQPVVPKKLEALASTPLAQTSITAAENAPNYSWVKKITIIAVLLWLLLVAGLLGVVLKIGANWQTYAALQWTMIVGLVLGPTLLIFVAGYALKQLSKISRQAHILSQTANALSTPEETVIGKSKTMAAAVSAQVDDVNEKLNATVGRLSSMEGAIKNQTQALNLANFEARETIDKINASVEIQNATLSSMTTSLNESMKFLSKNLTMHTENLAKSVQIAEQKIKEARISVEGATAKINSASNIVRSNTVQASATLSASHEDIKSIGDIIRQRSKELDQVYKKHASELTAMIEHLRDEQTSLGASMEQRLVKMRDLSLSAQASAESLSNASKSGKETIEALAVAASLADGAVKNRFAEMRDMVKYSTEHARSISDIAAQRVQNNLELTRKEIIRIEQDMADLQSRISDKKCKSLELISDNTLVDDHDNPQKISTSKRKRTRLELKPAIDIEAEQEYIKAIQPEPISKPNMEPIEKMPLEQTPINVPTPTNAPKTILEPVEKLAPISRPSDEAVRRTVPREEPRKQRTKARLGLFRNIFGRGGYASQPSALDIVGTVPPQPLNPSRPPTDDEILLADLTRLGLSANAVVDEGCIIEATNTRVTIGHKAMSRCVAIRLKNPVEHLVKSLTVDDTLSDKIIIFATRFDRTIELLTSNREAIRTRLESENGRAYLLCDAALNYGRSK